MLLVGVGKSLEPSCGDVGESVRRMRRKNVGGGRKKKRVAFFCFAVLAAFVGALVEGAEKV